MYHILLYFILYSMHFVLDYPNAEYYQVINLAINQEKTFVYDARQLFGATRDN